MTPNSQALFTRQL